jgi:hypothetical protein
VPLVPVAGPTAVATEVLLNGNDDPKALSMLSTIAFPVGVVTVLLSSVMRSVAPRL